MNYTKSQIISMNAHDIERLEIEKLKAHERAIMDNWEFHAALTGIPLSEESANDETMEQN